MRWAIFLLSVLVFLPVLGVAMPDYAVSCTGIQEFDFRSFGENIDVPLESCSSCLSTDSHTYEVFIPEGCNHKVILTEYVFNDGGDMLVNGNSLRDDAGYNINCAYGIDTSILGLCGNEPWNCNYGTGFDPDISNLFSTGLNIVEVEFCDQAGGVGYGVNDQNSVMLEVICENPDPICECSSIVGQGFDADGDEFVCLDACGNLETWDYYNHDDTYANACCGDDLSDSGDTQPGDYLCGMVVPFNSDTGQTPWHDWEFPGSSFESEGDVVTIVPISAKPYQALAGNQNWYACGDNHPTLNIVGEGQSEFVSFDNGGQTARNEFFCREEEQAYTFSECVGEAGFSVNDYNDHFGDIYTLGERVNVVYDIHRASSIDTTSSISDDYYLRILEVNENPTTTYFGDALLDISLQKNTENGAEATLFFEFDQPVTFEEEDTLFIPVYFVDSIAPFTVSFYSANRDEHREASFTITGTSASTPGYSYQFTYPSLVSDDQNTLYRAIPPRGNATVALGGSWYEGPLPVPSDVLFTISSSDSSVDYLFNFSGSLSTNTSSINTGVVGVAYPFADVRDEIDIYEANGLFSHLETDVGLGQWYLVEVSLDNLFVSTSSWGFTPRIGNISLNFDSGYANIRSGENVVQIGDIFVLNDQEQFTFCSEYDTSLQIPVHGWVTDLDTNTNNVMEGRDACERVPGMTWTGSQCCGDDLRFGTTYGQGSEFYADNESGCWNGVQVLDGEIVRLFDFSFTGTSFSDVYTYDCADADGCVFDLPVYATNDVNFPITIDDSENEVFFQQGSVLTNITNTFDTQLFMSKNTSSVLYADGAFVGCYAGLNIQATDNAGQPTSSSILAQDVSYTLVDGDACQIQGGYFCDPSGYWDSRVDNVEPGDVYDEDQNVTLLGELEFSAENRTKLSEHYQNANEFSCCPQNHCWDGTTCVEDWSNEPWKVPPDVQADGTGSRCIAGVWQQSEVKYDWDGRYTGYCPEQTDCFVGNGNNPEVISQPGNNTNPYCVGSGTYVGDYFCEDGSWGTRTRLLAGHLLNIAIDAGSNDYTLYCDDFESTLNHLGNVDGIAISDIFGGDSLLGANQFGCDQEQTEDVIEGCANNFCVLNYDDTVVFGTTTNENIEQVDSVLAQVFDIEDCQGLNSEFAECGGNYDVDGTYYYQADNQILLFVFETNSFLDVIFNFVTDYILDPIFGVLENILGLQSDDQTTFSQININFTTTTTSYNTFYIAKAQEGDAGRAREVTAVRERTYNPEIDSMDTFIGVAYEGFRENADICTYVEVYDASHELGDDLVCYTQIEGDYVRYDVFSNTRVVDDIWQGMTSSLRFT